jgi:histidine ammonia-lyase
MGANAATKALRVLKNVERILAIEMLTGCQALEFRGVEDTSPYLKKIVTDFRKSVPFVQDDVLMYELIDNSLKFIIEYPFETAV